MDCFCIAPVIRRIADDRKLQKAVLFVCPSGAVAEHFVRKDPGENKAQGKSNDDQDRSCKPGGGNIQGHDPQIVDRPLEIKSGNHDHNGWHGNGNPGISHFCFNEGGQKSGCQCSEKSRGSRWETGKINKLQT